MDGPTDQEIQRLNRSALAEVIEALAAGPEEQVALGPGRNNLPVDELIDDYVEWIYTAVPLISDAGLLPAGAIELLDQLNGCLSQPPPSPDYFEWPCERAVPSLAETTHYRPRGSSGS